jgi:predicted Ser/Thr protein kinase
MCKRPYSIIKTLKIDMFSVVYLALHQGHKVIIRDLNIGKRFPKIIAKFLNRNEVKILKKIDFLKCPNFPKLIRSTSEYTIRSYLSGTPIQQSSTKLNEGFYNKALELVQMLHQQGIVHNDLEKPENWIVMDNGEPGLIDFQLAKYFSKKTFLFKLLKNVEIRHVIKSKKQFCNRPLSPSELSILNSRGRIHKFMIQFIKPMYNFITRKIFNYSDRNFDEYCNK